jgi:hypothetical protein
MPGLRIADCGLRTAINPDDDAAVYDRVLDAWVGAQLGLARHGSGDANAATC